MLKPIVVQAILLPLYIIFATIGIKRKFSIKQHLLYFVFYFYVSAVISVTIFPLPMQKNLIQDMKALNYLHNNFVPFKSISQMMQVGNITIILRNILGNIILLSPLGFFIPLLFKRTRKISSILIIGLLCSSGIELAQYLISAVIGYTYKITDIDDIILNTIGVLAGFVLFKLVKILRED